MTSLRGLTPLESTPKGFDSPAPEQKPEVEQGFWSEAGAAFNNFVKTLGKGVSSLDEGYTPNVKGAQSFWPGVISEITGLPTYTNPEGKEVSFTPSDKQFVKSATIDVARDLSLNTLALASKIQPQNWTRPIDPKSSPYGKLVVGTSEALTDLIGAKQNWELTQEQRATFDLTQSVAANIYGGAIAYQWMAARAFTTGAFSYLSPAAQRLLRWGVGVGLEEALSSWGEYNVVGATGGSIADIPDDFVGFNLTGDKNPFSAFKLTPEDDPITGFVKAAFMNASLVGSIGGVVGGATKAVPKVSGKIAEGVRELPNIQRRVEESNAAKKVKAGRLWLERKGLQVKNEAGKWEFFKKKTSEEVKPEGETPVDTRTPKEAAEDLATQGPEVPEVDVVVKGIDELDNDALTRVNESEGSVLDAIEGELAIKEEFGTKETERSLWNIPELNPLKGRGNEQTGLFRGERNHLHPDFPVSKWNAIKDGLTGGSWDDGIGVSLQEWEALKKGTLPPARMREIAETLRTWHLPETPGFWDRRIWDADRLSDKWLKDFKRWGNEEAVKTILEQRERAKTHPLSSSYFDPHTLENKEAWGFKLSDELDRLAVEQTIDVPAYGGPRKFTDNELGEIDDLIGSFEDPTYNKLQKKIQQYLFPEKGDTPKPYPIDGKDWKRIDDLLDILAEEDPKAFADWEWLRKKPIDDAEDERLWRLNSGSIDPDEVIPPATTELGRIADNVEGIVNRIASQEGGYVPGQPRLDAFGEPRISDQLADRIKKMGDADVKRWRETDELLKRSGSINPDEVISAPDRPQDPGDGGTRPLTAGEQTIDVTPVRRTPLSDGLKAAIDASMELDRRIARRIGQNIDNQMAGLKKLRDGIEQVENPITEQVKTDIVQKAIDQGEVKPSSTEPTPVDEVGIDLNDVNTTPEQILGEEVRLADQYSKRDAAQDAAVEAMRKESIGYDDMSLEDKKVNGMLDGWERKSGLDERAEDLRVVLQQIDDDLAETQWLIDERTSRGLGASEDLDDELAELLRNKAEVEAQLADLDAGIEPLMSVKKDADRMYGKQLRKDRKVANFDPYLMKQLKDQENLEQYLRATINRVAGQDTYVHFESRMKVTSKMPDEWGGADVAGREAGNYHPMADLITINEVASNLPSSKILERLSTAFHESYHRIQFGLMTLDEMKIFDTLDGGKRQRLYASLSKDIRDPIKAKLFGKKIKMDLDWDQTAKIERMPIAFQEYAMARAQGIDPFERAMYVKVGERLDKHFPRADGNTWMDGKLHKTVIKIMTAWNKVYDVATRFGNYAKGRGFNSVDSLFEEAYSGRLGIRRRFDNAGQSIMNEFRLEELRAEIDHLTSLNEAAEKLGAKDTSLKLRKQRNKTFRAAELIGKTDYGDGPERMAVIKRWTESNQKAMKLIGDLEDRINALKTQAQKGGC